MAATFYLALLFIVLFSFKNVHPQIWISKANSVRFSESRCDFQPFPEYFIDLGRYKRLVLGLTITGFSKSRVAAIKWSKHGGNALPIPGHDPPTEITIFMDIAINPGPNSSLINRCEPNSLMCNMTTKEPFTDIDTDMCYRY